MRMMSGYPNIARVQKLQYCSAWLPVVGNEQQMTAAIYAPQLAVSTARMHRSMHE